MGVYRISEDNTAELSFDHASDYVVIVSEKPLNETESTTADRTTISPDTSDTSHVISFIMLLLFSVVGMIAVVSKKRREVLR